MTDCDHDFEYAHRRGALLGFRCAKCNAQRERPPNEAEAQWAAADPILKDHGPDDWHIHRVWWEFMRTCCEPDCARGELVMADYWEEQVEALTEKYPGHVRLLTCDDAFHASSDLILIEHMVPRMYGDKSVEEPAKYMGTSVVYVPQCAPGPVAEFFLYPGHRQSLLRALFDIEMEAQHVKEMEWLERSIRSGSRPRYEDGILLYVVRSETPEPGEAFAEYRRIAGSEHAVVRGDKVYVEQRQGLVRDVWKRISESITIEVAGTLQLELEDHVLRLTPPEGSTWRLWEPEVRTLKAEAEREGDDL